MKTHFGSLVVASVLLCLNACSSENEQEIEADLQEHFDTFIEEAAVYGVEISIADIDINGYIENIESRGTLGQCKSYSNGSKAVVIDQPFWNTASYIEREYVVFHELGHCLLNRDHDNSKDASGNCMSIMQSGEGDCRGEYTSENRNSLLNELFDF